MVRPVIDLSLRRAGLCGYFGSKIWRTRYEAALFGNNGVDFGSVEHG